MLDRLSRWKYLQLLSGVYLAMFLVRVSFGIIVITFGRYLKGVVGDFTYGVIIASTPFFELVTVIFAGIIVDRYGRKGVLLAGLALGALSLYLMGMTRPDPALGPLAFITFTHSLQGVSAAFILVTTLAIITAYAPADKRGREMGIFNFANLFGYFVGFAVGSFLLDVVPDLRYTFVVAGFLSTLGLVYGYLNIHEPKQEGEVERADFRQLALVFSNRRVQVLAALWLLVFVTVGSLLAFFSWFIVPDAAPAEAAAEVVQDAALGRRVGLGILAFGLVLISSQIAFGKLSDRYGRESMMVLGAAGFVTLSVALVLGADLTSAGFSLRHGAVGIVLLVAAFATLAFTPAGLAALADEARKRTEGTTMSAYTLVLALGSIIGPPLVGGVTTFTGPRGVFYFYFVVSVLFGLLVLARVYQVRAARAELASGPVVADEAAVRPR